VSGEVQKVDEREALPSILHSSCLRSSGRCEGFLRAIEIAEGSVRSFSSPFSRSHVLPPRTQCGQRAKSLCSYFAQSCNDHGCSEFGREAKDEKKTGCFLPFFSRNDTTSTQFCFPYSISSASPLSFASKKHPVALNTPFSAARTEIGERSVSA
jgi:hypothetical protein